MDRYFKSYTCKSIIYNRLEVATPWLEFGASKDLELNHFIAILSR